MKNLIVPSLAFVLFFPGYTLISALFPAFSGLTASWASQKRWDRLLAVLLAAAIIGTIGTIAYVVQTPRASEKFTEFYILGPGGKAVDYPRETSPGITSQVIAGIVNREQATITYRIEVNIDGQKPAQIGPLTLKPDEKWEQPVSFNATKPGLAQKVEFRLFRGEETEPYRLLHLWLDVNER